MSLNRGLALRGIQTGIDGNVMIDGVLSSKFILNSISWGTAVTAAHLLDGYLKFDPGAAARSVTLPTAVLIRSALGEIALNTAFEFVF